MQNFRILLVQLLVTSKLSFRRLTNLRNYPNIGDLIYQNEYREWDLPPLNLMIVYIYIRIFWIMTTYLWKLLNQITGWLIIPLGQASLFTFMLHLALIPIFWNIPEIFDDLNMLTATFWNAALIVVLFAAVKIRAWVAEDPMTCVARGAGLILEDFENLKDWLISIDEH